MCGEWMGGFGEVGVEVGNGRVGGVVVRFGGWVSSVGCGVRVMEGGG